MIKLRRFARVALSATLGTSLLSCTAATKVPSIFPSQPLALDIANEPVDESAVQVLPAMDGTLNGYLGFAIKQSPRVRAAFEAWRAARFHISRAMRLPEPTLSFGYFVRSVETRVGPQRYKLGVSQLIPWIGKLRANEAASTEMASAAALVTDAEVLALRRKVANAYWSVWLIKQENYHNTEHDVVLESLAATVRGRVQIGAATLADLSQVDLAVARHHDHIGVDEEARRRATARLVGVLGAKSSSDIDLKTSDAPNAGMPVIATEELVEKARNHPLVGRFGHLAKSEEDRARAEAADRYPRFMVGANWVGTTERDMPGLSDNGKDALVVSAGLSIPLWGSSYADAESSALAKASAHRAMQESSRRNAEAEVLATLAILRDSLRRIKLYRDTLIPQAETTFQAVLGGYQVKTSTVAAVLLAQRELIELQLQHARARALHAKTWANLEYLVGVSLQRGNASND